jgi:hypothetical protein
MVVASLARRGSRDKNEVAEVAQVIYQLVSVFFFDMLSDLQTNTEIVFPGHNNRYAKITDEDICTYCKW